MALSGTFKNNFRTGYGIEVDWSATQSVTNNTSTITAKVYWCSYGSSYTVSSSATKTAYATIDGSTGSTSAGGLASLSGNQRKLIYTYSKTVTHNSDGTKSVGITGKFDCAVTLGGTYYSSVSVSGTASLNTIPRKSTLSDTTPDFTAGSDINITVSRYSSSFTHKLYIDIADSAGTYTNIKSIDYGSNLTMSTAFSVAEKETIFAKMNGRASATVRYNLHTYSGGTDIGYNTYYGTATAPNASTITSFTPEVTDDYQSNGIYVDQTTTFTITRGDTEFIHTLEFYVGSTKIKTVTGVGTSYAWTPTQTEMDTIYNAMTTVNEMDGKILVYTYYNGGTDRLVRSATEKDINFHVRNSDPTFTVSQISYKDSNTTVTAITGNNQYIVQGKSTVTASLLSLATGVNKATITKYEFTLNGVTKSLTAVGDLDFGTMNASTDLTLTVKVTDSRGNTTTVSKVVNIVPYKEPVVTTTAKRTNNYEDETTITLSGSISLVPVGTTPVNKNSISYMQYRYKELSATTWGSWTSFTYTMSGANYTATSVILTLDNQKAYSLEVKTQDKFVTTTVAMTVAVGQPIFFIDSVKKSVGVGTFPTASESFEVNGMLEITGGSKGYLNFNNTALVANDGGANGAQDGTNYDHIWHDDSSNTWHFVSDKSWHAEGNSTIRGGKLVAEHSGGQALSLNDTGFVDGTTGMYNYIGFNDGAGSYQAYVGFASSRDNVMQMLNKLGKIKLNPEYGKTGGTVEIYGNSLNIDPKAQINTGIEIGSTSLTSDAYSFIDFHSSVNSKDYDARIISYGGDSSANGEGRLDLYAGDFWFRNGNIYATENLKELWNGAAYMHSGQTITPTVPLSQCPTGWLLQWCDYASGTANDWDFCYTVVPKNHATNASGTGTHHVVAYSLADETYTGLMTKYLYIRDGYFTGHDTNDNGNGANVVLRRVFMF